ncbi:MAG: DoxX family protein [bacterium]|nr:DoxX family protein [bacterium]
MTPSSVGFWLATSVFCVVLGVSGFANFARLDFMVQNMVAHGYPVYFMTILGFAKLAGVVALLVPGRPLLKEWAYAGFAFNLLGATATHVFSGDPIGEAARPAIVLCVGVASYLLRPTARRLPESIVVGHRQSYSSPLGS